jgi:hypothetical protein
MGCALEAWPSWFDSNLSDQERVGESANAPGLDPGITEIDTQTRFHKTICVGWVRVNPRDCKSPA